MGKAVDNWRQTELNVLKALKPYGKFYKSTEEFSPFDLYGETANTKTLIEIKNRSEIFSHWYIEKAKIDKLMKLKNSADYKIRVYLFMVVGKECFVYNAEEVFKCPVKEVYINNYTYEDFAFGKKKSIRKLYCFPFNTFKTKLKL